MGCDIHNPLDSRMGKVQPVMDKVRPTDELPIQDVAVHGEEDPSSSCNRNIDHHVIVSCESTVCDGNNDNNNNNNINENNIDEDNQFIINNDDNMIEISKTNITVDESSTNIYNYISKNTYESMNDKIDSAIINNDIFERNNNNNSNKDEDEDHKIEERVNETSDGAEKEEADRTLLNANTSPVAACTSSPNVSQDVPMELESKQMLPVDCDSLPPPYSDGAPTILFSNDSLDSRITDIATLDSQDTNVIVLSSNIQTLNTNTINYWKAENSHDENREPSMNIEDEGEVEEGEEVEEKIFNTDGLEVDEYFEMNIQEMNNEDTEITEENDEEFNEMKIHAVEIELSDNHHEDNMISSTSTTYQDVTKTKKKSRWGPIVFTDPTPPNNDTANLSAVVRKTNDSVVHPGPGQRRKRVRPQRKNAEKKQDMRIEKEKSVVRSDSRDRTNSSVLRESPYIPATHDVSPYEVSEFDKSFDTDDWKEEIERERERLFGRKRGYHAAGPMEAEPYETTRSSGDAYRIGYDNFLRYDELQKRTFENDVSNMNLNKNFTTTTNNSNQNSYMSNNSINNRKEPVSTTNISSKETVSSYRDASRSTLSYPTSRREDSRDRNTGVSRDGIRDRSIDIRRDGSRDRSIGITRDGSRDRSRGTSRDGSRDRNKNKESNKFIKGSKDIDGMHRDNSIRSTMTTYRPDYKSRRDGTSSRINSKERSDFLPSHPADIIAEFSPIHPELEQSCFEETILSNPVSAELGEKVDDFLREIGIDESAGDEISMDHLYNDYDETLIANANSTQYVDKEKLLEKFDEWMASSF